MVAQPCGGRFAPVSENENRYQLGWSDGGEEHETTPAARRARRGAAARLHGGGALGGCPRLRLPLQPRARLPPSRVARVGAAPAPPRPRPLHRLRARSPPPSRLRLVRRRRG